MSSIVLNVHVGTPKRLTQRAQITLQDYGGTPESAPEQHRFSPDEGVISFVNTNNRWEQS